MILMTWQKNIRDLPRGGDGGGGGGRDTSFDRENIYSEPAGPPMPTDADRSMVDNAINIAGRQFEDNPRADTLSQSQQSSEDRNYAQPDLSHLPGGFIGESEPSTSFSDTPVYSGSILPYTKYADDSIRFDPNAGLLGSAYSAFGNFKQALDQIYGQPTDNTNQLMEVDEDGHLVPSQAVKQNMSGLAGTLMTGSFPLGAAEALSGGYNPNVIRSFMGADNPLANTANLAKAERYESMGATPSQLWQETGWERGPSGAWRSEFSDESARLNPLQMDQNGDLISRSAPLSSILQHDLLYSAYPEAADVPAYLGQMEKGVGGYYRRAEDPTGQLLAVNSGDAMAAQQGGMLPLDVSIHEVGHLIQDFEGWPRGGSPQDPAIYQGMPQIQRQGREVATQLEGERMQFINESGLDKDLADYVWSTNNPDKAAALNQAYKDMNALSFEAYPRLAGEVEANVAMQRRAWNDEQRRQIAPSSMMPVPYTSQIIRTPTNEFYVPKFKFEDGGRVSSGEEGLIENALNLAKV